MIDFIKKFSENNFKKMNYFIVGNGEEEEEIKLRLLNYKKYFKFKIIKKVKKSSKFYKKK